MEVDEIYGNNKIHLTLKALIDEKSKKDGLVFTIYQLAKALDMPHSVIARLIHPSPEKRVKNPRIDTLTKIVEFFRADGFNVTVEDFLSGYKEGTQDVQKTSPVWRTKYLVEDKT